MSIDIRINQEFKPAPQLAKLYFTYLWIWIGLLVVPWLVPVLIFAPLWAGALAVAPVLALILFVSWWIPKYYDTVVYKLTQDEVVWRRGVWFKKTGVVPYNRITNIDISQGPISRRLGIAVLRIQTAGYSGQARAEIRLEGIERFEELRGVVLGFVKGRKPEAVEAQAEVEGDAGSKVLAELVKIRELLEQKK